MPSTEDWVMEAAYYILGDAYLHRWHRHADTHPPDKTVDDAAKARIATIIAKHAEPLLALLREARREHSRGYNDEVCDYPPCPRSYEDETGEPCTCGADTWNARIDVALPSSQLRHADRTR